MEFIKSQGGREKYFKRANVKDCVVRAICNATGEDYQKTYDGVRQCQEKFYRQMGVYKGKKVSPRNGVPQEVTKEYIEKELKWKWHPLKNANILDHKFGKSTYIVQMKKHLTCIKENKLYDSWDCQNKKDKTVLGYWSKI